MSSSRRRRSSETPRRSYKPTTVLLDQQLVNQIIAQIPVPPTPAPQVSQFSFQSGPNIGRSGTTPKLIQGVQAQIALNTGADTVLSSSSPITSIVASDLDGPGFSTLAATTLKLLTLAANFEINIPTQTQTSSVAVSVLVTTSAGHFSQSGPLLLLSPGSSSGSGIVLSGSTALNVTVPAGSSFLILFQLVNGRVNDSAAGYFNASITYTTV